MKKKLVVSVALGSLMLLTGCMSEGQLKDQMTKILKENPKVLTEAIEANPAEFVESFQNAVRNAQSELAKKREAEEKKKLEELYERPLEPEIRSDEAIRGPKDAPLTLIEYSDFECPYCERGYNTVNDLMKKYNGKIRFVYKHLPLPGHPNAIPAARYFEAARMQSPELAFKFHDEVFKNFRKLRQGESFLKSAAKKAGLNMKKLAKDIKKPELMDRIEADKSEANKFGFGGTPGFLINGIPVKGAYPTSHFVQIIDELKKRGKVKL